MACSLGNIHHFLQANDVSIQFPQNLDDALRHEFHVEATALMDVVSGDTERAGRRHHCCRNLLLSLEHPAEQFGGTLSDGTPAPIVEENLPALVQIASHIALEPQSNYRIPGGQVHFIVDTERTIIKVGGTHHR